MAKYTLMKTEGRAKRAQFETVHGTIQTPVFMNVGTVGAIKGAVSTMDSEGYRNPVAAFQYLSSPCKNRRQADPGIWRTSQIYGLGQTDSH